MCKTTNSGGDGADDPIYLQLDLQETLSGYEESNVRKGECE